jgi:hypothetical protein
MKMTLSALLLRRKELKTQTDLRNVIRERISSYDPQVTRRMVDPTNGIEEVNAVIPRYSREEIERECDFYSHQWRLADGAIQQANHTVKVTVAKSVMKDFVTGAVVSEDPVSETLASLLIRRKMLETKCSEVLARVDFADFSEKRTTRIKSFEGVGAIVDGVEKKPLYELLRKQLYYVRQLRLCEEAIQLTNSIVAIDVEDSVFTDFAV